MPEMIRVKPAEAGTIVRNPDRKLRPLADAGELVPHTVFWTRRLRAGDVVEVAEEKDAAAPETSADPAVKSSEPVAVPPAEAPAKDSKPAK